MFVTLITDQVRAGESNMKYCLTQNMMADNFMKPVQRALLRKFKVVIMNIHAGVLDIDLAWD